MFVGNEAKAQAFERALWEEGVYALAIVYPNGWLGQGAHPHDALGGAFGGGLGLRAVGIRARRERV